MSEKKRVASSAALVAATPLINQGLGFFSALILTHFLLPDVYGLFALVGTAAHSLQMMMDTGIGDAVIRSKDPYRERFLRTAWTIQLARGLFLLFVSCGLAYPIASFYQKPELAAVLPLVAFSFFLEGSVSGRLWIKQFELQFGPLAVCTLSARVVQITVTILWAWYRPDVYAFAVGQLVGSTVKLFLSYMIIKDSVLLPCFDREAFIELKNFAKWSIIQSPITYGVESLLSLAIPLLFSFEFLGYFAVANRLLAFPKNLAGQLASRFLLPVLSRSRNDHTKMKRRIRYVKVVLLCILCAVLSTMILLSEEIVRFCFSERFADVATIFSVLAIAFVLRLVAYVIPGQALFRVIGDFNIATGILFIELVAQAVSIGLVDWLSLSNSIIYTKVAASLVCLLLTQWYFWKRGFATFFIDLILLSSFALTCLGGWYLRENLFQDFSSMYQVLVQSLLSASIWTATFFILKKKEGLNLGIGSRLRHILNSRLRA